MALGEKKSVVMEEQMGVPGGVATLDEGGKLTQSQIPSMDFAEAGTKNTLDDGDAVAITDSTEDNATKRVLWSTVKSLLGNLFVPLTRTVNGKALSSDITLSASDVGARANTWTPTAGQVGAVPTTRKVNNKALSSDVTLDAEDVGAAERNYMRSAVVGIGATSYTGWFRVGRIRIDSAYKTSRTLLLVKGSASKGSGILDIVVRTESSAGVLNTATSKLVWHTLTDSYMKNRFAIIVEGNYADLYLNEDGKYWYYNISVLDYMESTTDFTDPSYANIFKLERNYDLSGEYRKSITPLLTSSIGFTPEIMGAVAASGWVNGRLLVGGSTGGVTQLGHPSSAGSVLRSGTSGGPYWTSIADLIAAMGAVRIKCGTYTGNGEYDSESSYTSVPQTINLGLKPKAVLVMSETGGMDSGSGRYYGGLVWDGSDLVVFLDTNYGDINAKVITLTNSGFTVYAQRVQMSSSSYRYIATNEDGLKYRYIVFY